MGSFSTHRPHRKAPLRGARGALTRTPTPRRRRSVVGRVDPPIDRLDVDFGERRRSGDQRWGEQDLNGALGAYRISAHEWVHTGSTHKNGSPTGTAHKNGCTQDQRTAKGFYSHNACTKSSWLDCQRRRRASGDAEGVGGGGDLAARANKKPTRRRALQAAGRRATRLRRQVPTTRAAAAQRASLPLQKRSGAGALDVHPGLDHDRRGHTASSPKS